MSIRCLICSVAVSNLKSLSKINSKAHRVGLVNAVILEIPENSVPNAENRNLHLLVNGNVNAAQRILVNSVKNVVNRSLPLMSGLAQNADTKEIKVNSALNAANPEDNAECKMQNVE